MKTELPTRIPPFEHQQRAFEFAMKRLLDTGGSALLMEMGTGKSYVSIAIAGALWQQGRIRRVLVVAPLSVLSVWESEFPKFAAFPFGFTTLAGTIEKKRQQLKDIPKNTLQIVAVNYESAWRLEPELLKFRPDLVIADEAHKIKEARTRQSKVLHHLGDIAPYKLLLTGTVITNRESDVFSQYRFMDRTVYGDSFYRFRNRYFDMTGYGNHTPRFRECMRSDFLTRLHSRAFRVTKEECLDLPETIDEVRSVSLEPSAMKIYRDIEKECYAELEGSEVSVLNVLSRLLRLSQITGGHVTDDDGKTNKVSTAKLDALEDIIDSMVADGRKLIVMARFIPEMDEIEAMLQKKRIQYAVIRGGIIDRDDQVFTFQHDPECMVFLGQIAAAGLGLTLTAASTMVFYSLDYSMSNYEQAKARIHRVGQKNTCHYIHLVAEKTVDAKVIKALKNKTDLARSIVDDWRSGKTPFA